MNSLDISLIKANNDISNLENEERNIIEFNFNDSNK